MNARRPANVMRSALCAICLLPVIVGQRALADVPVTARTIDGPDQSGTLVSIDPSGVVLDVAGTARPIALAELLQLSCDAARPQDAPAASRLFLTSGDRLAVDVVHLHEDSFVCRWPAHGENTEFEFALETITGMLLQPGPERRAQQALERELELREFQTDVLFLTNGDRLSGVLEEFNRDACRCETAVGPLDVNRSRLRAIGFNAALLAPVEPSETRLLLHLTDGSWLTCRSVDWNGGSDMQVASVTGAPIPLPIGKLHSICCYGPRITPLSDLEPVETVMTPYLARPTPPLPDRNVYGGPLIVRGESFARGYGMYSRTAATFALDRAWGAFRADVGIDDASNGAGSVVFTVDVDGERVFESGPVTPRDGTLPIGPIDLRRAQSMTLTVDFDALADIGDVADWCNPVLIRDAGPRPED